MPDLRFAPLTDMDFAVSCPLVRRWRLVLCREKENRKYSRFTVRCQVIWAKNTFAWGFGRYKFQHEPIFYAHVARYHETNFSMAYSSHISWESTDSPAPTEVYPSLAFDNLFENRGLLRNASILDRVRDRAESLSQRVSATDRAKIDEYLTSLREVERRVERMRVDKSKADEDAKGKNRPAWTMERPANGLPADLRTTRG